MAGDGIAVAEYLHGEFPGSKIVLIGQDWGGLLGLRMVRLRPDLFTAFVGTGQIVNLFAQQEKQYEYTRSRAVASHDSRVLTSLNQMGPPPYPSLEGYRRFAEYFEPVKPQEDLACEGRLTELLAVTPSLSIVDVYYWVKALRSGEELLNSTLMREDLLKTDGAFSVPVFFIQGGDDIITPTSLVSEYVSKIAAPVKSLKIVPGAAHFVMWTRPSEFLESLREDMRSATAEH
jgi:pimeloyl-ACP methyl ester carboxylesterase